jgi:hypothetical protein
MEEVLHSNLGRDTDYPDWLAYFVVFLSPSHQMPEEYLDTGTRSFPSKFLPIYLSSSLPLDTIQSRAVTDSAVK